MLSKKDYKKIAEIFKNTNSKDKTYEEILDQFIDFLQEDNPRFSIDKFLEAIEN